MKEANSVVIAGMGGMEIIKILENKKEVLQKEKQRIPNK